jgi:DNA-binding NtrC family response regulator
MLRPVATGSSHMPSTDTTILIIDDDPLHLKIYTWILQREGYRCLTAVVGSTSVNLPMNEAVDLVLLDYRLNSSLRSPDVAQLVERAFPSAPIVVLSEAPWMPDDMRSHAAGFVNKGSPTMLLETLGKVLESRHSRA